MTAANGNFVLQLVIQYVALSVHIGAGGKQQRWRTNQHRAFLSTPTRNGGAQPLAILVKYLIAQLRWVCERSYSFKIYLSSVLFPKSKSNRSFSETKHYECAKNISNGAIFTDKNATIWLFNECQLVYRLPFVYGSTSVPGGYSGLVKSHHLNKNSVSRCLETELLKRTLFTGQANREPACFVPSWPDSPFGAPMSNLNNHLKAWLVR